jgi:hypothetical protein
LWNNTQFKPKRDFIKSNNHWGDILCKEIIHKLKSFLSFCYMNKNVLIRVLHIYLLNWKNKR